MLRFAAAAVVAVRLAARPNKFCEGSSFKDFIKLLESLEPKRPTSSKRRRRISSFPAPDPETASGFHYLELRICFIKADHSDYSTKYCFFLFNENCSSHSAFTDFLVDRKFVRIPTETSFGRRKYHWVEKRDFNQDGKNHLRAALQRGATHRE